FQLVQEKLARMATDLTAARLLVYRAAWEADRGAQRVTLEAAMAKAFAAEAAQRIVDDAVQLLGGGRGVGCHPVEPPLRGGRARRGKVGGEDGEPAPRDGGAAAPGRGGALTGVRTLRGVGG